MIFKVFNSKQSAQDWVNDHRFLEDLRDEMYLKRVTSKFYEEFWLCDSKEFLGRPNLSPKCVMTFKEAKRK